MADLLTSAEAAARLGLTERQLVRAYRERQQIPYHKSPTGHVLFRPADLDAYGAAVLRPRPVPARNGPLALTPDADPPPRRRAHGASGSR